MAAPSEGFWQRWGAFDLCELLLMWWRHRVSFVIREMQKKWEYQGKPHLDIGIGLNSGVASVGNMGSALRYGYTALGDTVNLSSRLEGLNKDYGTHILVHETTYSAVKGDGFVFRELDLIRVKGKLQPVTIYELIGRASENSV
jgi:adenylate cyclase